MLHCHVRPFRSFAFYLACIMAMATPLSLSLSADAQPAAKGVSSAGSQIPAVKVTLPNGSEKFFPKIQDAIDFAPAKSVIMVSDGDWKERLSIKNKTGLTLRSSANAVVEGLDIEKSTDILVDGFSMKPPKPKTEAILIFGANAKQAQKITLQNTIIQNSVGNAFGSGLVLKGGDDKDEISLTSCDISQNRGHGVWVNGFGGKLTITDSVISANGLNGLLLDTDGHVFLSKNKIQGNGTANQAQGKKGYGIARDLGIGQILLAWEIGQWILPWFDPYSPARITLEENLIIHNRGEVRPGVSSLDIFGIPVILNKNNEPRSGNQGDFKNETTAGTEGPGVTKYQGGLTAVPTLWGLSEAAARQALASASLEFGEMTSSYSDTMPHGLIIEQSPTPGTMVSRGSPVNVVVSAGPMPTVPLVLGLTESDALMALSAANLAMGTRTEEFSPTIKIGAILSQDPVAGTRLAAGSRVNLVISLGPIMVTVPEVTSLSQSSAEQKITESGLTVAPVISAYDDAMPAGQVVRQEPQAGFRVPEGAIVQLVVSLGKKLAPDLVGLSQEAASAQIAQDNYALGIVSKDFSDTIAANHVISQEPAAGTSWPSGSSISLVVSLGPQPRVPDVTSLIQSAASSAIESAGLKVGHVSFAYDDSYPLGQVMAQSPSPGERVLPGAVVDIVISLGVMPTVPSLVGLPKPVAEAAIQAAYLSIGTIGSAYSDTVIFGSVITQDPPAGTRLAKNSQVNFTISLGAELVAVPAVVGLSELAASDLIVQYGFVVGSVVKQYDDHTPVGKVISQDPTADKRAARHSAVNLVVSLGGQPTAVPNLIGLSEDQAKNVVVSSGFQIGDLTRENSTTVAAGLVLSQNPGAGETWPRGSKLNLVVSSGNSLVVEEPSGTPAEQEQEFQQCLNDKPLPSPELPLGQQVTFYDGISFLLVGPNATQKDVKEGLIVKDKASVLWGRVRKTNGEALVGAKIIIWNDEGYGYTLSRDCGDFFMVVNGGGKVTLDVSADGFLSSHRSINDLNPGQYARVENVILRAFDANVSTIPLSTLTELAVAQGSLITDLDGTRQVTMFFPPGTKATHVKKDGSQAPLSTINVRATEYTVGRGGYEAMPAPIAANTTYTYAVELSVDGVSQDDSVVFNEPIPLYVDDFLGFPVGSAVPTGYYDRKLAQWVPTRDGRVIQILGFDGDFARLDVTGSGEISSSTELSRMGIDSAELKKLKEVYAASPLPKSLWRSPISHFSIFDLNWTPTLEPGAAGPDIPKDFPEPLLCGSPNPAPGSGDGSGRGNGMGDREKGSTIHCRRQVLGESIDITGTPFSLVYKSDRVPGYKSNGTIKVPMLLKPGSITPRSTRTIISVGGKDTVIEAPFGDVSVPWDGKDLFGRTLLGSQKVKVSLSYRFNIIKYNPVHYSPESESFGAIYQNLVDGGSLEFDGPYIRQGAELGLEKSWFTKVGGIDARIDKLGGWTLDIHHNLDIASNKIYYGDGRVQDATATALHIVAADKSLFPSADISFSDQGYDPSNRELYHSLQGSVFIPDRFLAGKFGPDGRLYMLDRDRLIAFSPTSKSVEYVKGIEGEGDEAHEVVIDTKCGYQQYFANLGDYAFAPDGTLYFVACAPTGKRDTRIKRVDPITRKITLVENALTESLEECAVDGYYPIRLAVAPDGALFYSGPRVYQNGPTLPNGGTVPCLAKEPPYPKFTYDEDGFVKTGGNFPIRRIGLNGKVSTVGFLDDIFKPVMLVWVQSLSFDNHSNLYISASSNTGSGVTGMLTKEGKLKFPAFASDISLPSDGSYNAVSGDGSTIYYWDSLYCQGICKAESNGQYSRIAGLGSPEELYWPDVTAPRNRLFQLPTMTNLPLAESGDPARLSTQTYPWVAIDQSGTPYFALRDNQKRMVIVALSRQPTTVSDDGSELYIFDQNGKHLETKDTLTGSTLYKFTYDESHFLTAVTDAFGNQTTIVRDGNGDAKEIISPYGQRTGLQVNSDGFLAKVIDPANNAWRMTYHKNSWGNENGLLATFVDRNGNERLYEFDQDGLLSKAIDPQQNTKTLSRQIDGRNLTVNFTSPMGRITKHVVENLSNGDIITRKTLPNGNEFVSKSQKSSSAEHLLNADGSSSSLASMPSPLFGTKSLLPQTMSISPGMGITYKETYTRDLIGGSQSRPWEVTLQKITIVQNDDPQKTFNVETNNNPSIRTVTSTTPEGYKSSVQFDAFNRVVREQRPGIYPTTYDYDDRGRLAAVTQGTDGCLPGPECRRTTFTYVPDGKPGAGNIASVTDPLNNMTSFERDVLGRVVKTTEMPSHDSLIETFYSYDANGNVKAIQPPGRPAHRFDFDALDQNITYGPPKVDTIGGGGATGYEFNADSDLIAWKIPEEDPISYDYSANGELKKINTPTGAINFSYDGPGRKITRIWNSNGGPELVFAYDKSLLTQKTFINVPEDGVSTTLAINYNNDLRVASHRLGNESPVTYSYDNDGVLSSAGALALTRDNAAGGGTGQIASTRVGNVVKTNAYDSFGHLIGTETKVNGNVIYASSFGRDRLGRISSREEVIQGSATSHAYVYNGLGQLVGVTGTTYNATYSYDANGNRLDTGATYDDQDRLLTHGSTSYTYTASGSLKTKVDAARGETTRYEYDVFGGLKSVQLPHGVKITYGLAPSHRRVSRQKGTEPAVGYIYEDELRIAAEIDKAGNIVSRFVYGESPNVPDYMVRDGVTYALVTDERGSVRLVVNAQDGTVAQRMDYDPWGVVTKDTNPGFQPFGFAGGLYNTDTGLVRFGARDYDATTGRWINKDPILFNGGDLNLYGYVSKDPINLTDPNGLASQCTRPLINHSTGKPYPQIGSAYHSFLCYTGPDGLTHCGGKAPSGSPLNSPGKIEPDTPNSTCKDVGGDKPKCMDRCIGTALNSKLLTGTYRVTNQNCHQYADRVISACKASCGLGD